MFKNKAELATFATFLSLLSFVLFDVIGQNLTSPEEFVNLVNFQDQILSSLTARIGELPKKCSRGDGIITLEGNKVKIYDKDGIATVGLIWITPDWRGGRKHFFFGDFRRKIFPQNVEFEVPPHNLAYGISFVYSNSCGFADGFYSIVRNTIYKRWP